jgi:hypothetical protein
MQYHLRDRLAGYFAGHGLHITPQPGGCWCVARCDCQRWFHEVPDRRRARDSYHQHLEVAARARPSQ